MFLLSPELLNVTSVLWSFAYWENLLIDHEKNYNENNN